MPGGLPQAINGQASLVKRQTKDVVEEHKSSLVMRMMTAA